MNIREKLVDDWKQMHKKWSVWLAGIAIALQTFLIEFPDFFLQAWNQLPTEFKSVIPPGVMKAVPIALMALSILAKFIKQPKLAAPVTFFALAMLAPLSAMAACPVTSACIEFIGTAGWDSGAALPSNATVTYNVYRYVSTGNTGTLLKTITQAPWLTGQKLSVQIDNEPAGNQCYIIKATFELTTSDGSSPIGTACKNILPANVKLLPPTNVIVK